MKKLNKQETIAAVNNAFDARIAREESENKMNANKYRELNSARKEMLYESALSYMLKHNIADFSFIDTQAQKTLKKIARAMRALATKDATLLDKHTRKVLRQAFYVADHERFYSYEELQSMQSQSVTTSLSTSLDQNERAQMIATSTLSTQTSTSVKMLEFLKMCETRVDSARKYVRFNLDRKEIAFLNATSE